MKLIFKMILYSCNDVNEELVTPELSRDMLQATRLPKTRLKIARA